MHLGSQSQPEHKHTVEKAMLFCGRGGEIKRRHALHLKRKILLLNIFKGESDLFRFPGAKILPPDWGLLHRTPKLVQCRSWQYLETTASGNLKDLLRN